MDPTAGLIVGTGWASGINLYGVVALLNIYGRLGLGDLPEGLTSTPVLIGSLVMYSLEFVADKIPYLDNVWDLVHTAIRPIGAGILGLVLTGEAEGLNQAVAAFGSAGLALTSHAAKSTSRVAINTSPEPISNVVVSLAEDGLVAVVTYFALEHPLIAVVAVAVLLILGVLLIRALVGMAYRGVRKVRSLWRQLTVPGDPSAS